MASNFKQPGETIRFTAGKNVAAGDLVIIGKVAGVSLRTTAKDEVGDAKVTGVFELPAAASATGAQGAVAYATSTGTVTGTESGNTAIGKFWQPLLSGEKTALVKLNA